MLLLTINRGYDNSAVTTRLFTLLIIRTHMTIFLSACTLDIRELLTERLYVIMALVMRITGM